MHKSPKSIAIAMINRISLMPLESPEPPKTPQPLDSLDWDELHEWVESLDEYASLELPIRREIHNALNELESLMMP